jgi:hypothetical protein
MNEREKNLSLEKLKENLHYDPETGIFTRKKKTPSGPTGTIAGYKRKGGEINVRVGKQYLAHRLAWFYMTGEWPKLLIDHKNGNPSDNRWCNLREATHSQNCQNTPHRGVSWHKHYKKWGARSWCNGKSNHIGWYETEVEALEAYEQFKLANHPFYIQRKK